MKIDTYPHRMVQGVCVALAWLSAQAVLGQTAPSSSGIPPAVSLPAGACAGQSYCKEVAELAMIVNNVRASQWTDTRSRLVAMTVTFHNKLRRPLVLGYDNQSAVVVDDIGNRYTIQNVRGIPAVRQGQHVDTSFLLQPGETREARFEFLWQGTTVFGTVFDVDLAVRELNLLAGNQVRFGKEHVLSIGGMKPFAAGAGSGAVATRPDAAATTAAAAMPDPCNGSSNCFASGPFVAEVARVRTSQPGNGPVNAERVNRFEIRFRNVSDKPLILAYEPNTGIAIDDNGNRYAHWNRFINIGGIGRVEGNQIDTSFVLRPGESRIATFELRFVYDSRRVAPADRYTFDLAVQEVEELPGGQLRVVREHAISFHDLTSSGRTSATGDAPPNIVDSLKKLLKK